MQSAPEISILLPLGGDPLQALLCLEGIAAQQDAPAYEVILFCAQSERLAPLLSGLAGDVEVIWSDRQSGLHAALSAGLERATGEILVILREGAVPQPGWLAPLAAALAEPSTGLVASASARPEEPTASPLTAPAIAGRRSELQALGLPVLSDELTFAAIALALAERGLKTHTLEQSRAAPPAAEQRAARLLPPGRPEVTVVIPTLDSTGAGLQRCLHNIHDFTDTAYEIVIIDNGAPPQGFAAPVNAGLRAVTSPYAVVMNDDVEVEPGWWPPLRAALQTGALLACPTTIEGGMRDDFPAWCFALATERMPALEHAPGEFFDPHLVVWYQDTDLLRRLRQAGSPPVIVKDSHIRHGLSRTVASDDPGLRAWIEMQTAIDRERFLQKHPGLQLSAMQLPGA